MNQARLLLMVYLDDILGPKLNSGQEANGRWRDGSFADLIDKFCLVIDTEAITLAGKCGRGHLSSCLPG